MQSFGLAEGDMRKHTLRYGFSEFEVEGGFDNQCDEAWQQFWGRVLDCTAGIKDEWRAVVRFAVVRSEAGIIEVRCDPDSDFRFPVTRPYRRVSEFLATAGYAVRGDAVGIVAPYHPFQVQEWLIKGLAEMVLEVLGMKVSAEERERLDSPQCRKAMRELVRRNLRTKRTYCKH